MVDLGSMRLQGGESSQGTGQWEPCHSRTEPVRGRGRGCPLSLFTNPRLATLPLGSNRKSIVWLFSGVFMDMHKCQTSELLDTSPTEMELCEALLSASLFMLCSEPGFSGNLSNSVSFHTELNMVLVTSLFDTNF